MSATGTALGPSLGGVLIDGFGWRVIFLLLVPLGILTLHLSHRDLPADRREPGAARPRFDTSGTLLLVLTLTAYALAMTLDHGRLGPLNVALLLGSAVGGVLFVAVESRSASPLVRWTMLRDPVLGASIAKSALVSTVMMTTLVVGPFYLSQGLGLPAAVAGLVLAAGPVAAALTGVPAGRWTDRYGTQRMTLVGLLGIAAACVALATMPATLGVPGYLAPIVLMTAGYALFQTANNTTVMTDVRADQRGVISGMLNLSRNLGLMTGASVMGAVFVRGSATIDLTTANATQIAIGMRISFAVAAVLILLTLALSITLGTRNRTQPRPAASGDAALGRQSGASPSPPSRTVASRTAPWVGRSPDHGPDLIARKPASRVGAAAPRT